MNFPGPVFLIVFFGNLLTQAGGPKTDTFVIDGKEVKVTHQVDQKFYGKYSGSAGGYLLLNNDGSGEYLADYYGYALPSCQPGAIRFHWGFLLDEHNSIVKFKRDYGYSFPVVYVSDGPLSFQGCRKKILVDYLLVRKDGSIGVSSSDDWEKNH